MNTPHRSLDTRSGWVFDTHELGRRAGAMKRVRRTVDAPSGLGGHVIGVPQGSPVRVDVMLESVVEGVLVTGSAQLVMEGECGRCLTGLREEMTVSLQELYVYPGSHASEEEASRLEGDLLDLEPLLRDEVVLALPFQPLCREDCAGLCPECGADLNADPEHTHEAAPDARWERLARLKGTSGEPYDVSGGHPTP
jgi:uncharacterized protein